MEKFRKILKAAETGNEKKVMEIFKKSHGVAYRACFSDALIDLGWKLVVRNNRDNRGLLKNPKGKIIDPFWGYRKKIDYAVSRISKPGFYFVLNWGIIPKQKQLNEFREVVKKFSQQRKEICLLRLERLGAWFVLIGGKETISFKAKLNSIDKKYFQKIYDGDLIEIDIDIHNHLIDLDVSLDDRDGAKNGDCLRSFYVVTYQDGFAPYTARGRIHNREEGKIVIPWNKIRKEFRKIRTQTHLIS